MTKQYAIQSCTLPDGTPVTILKKSVGPAEMRRGMLDLGVIGLDSTQFADSDTIEIVLQLRRV